MIQIRRDAVTSQESTTSVLREMLAGSAEPALPPVKIIDDIKPIENYAYTSFVELTPAPDTASKTAPKRSRNLPTENMELILSEDDLKKINDTQSFHVVLRIMIEGKLHYIKMNAIDSVMSPIEAGISGVNRFLIDDLAASSRAVYKMENNKAVYFGVASRAIEDFKSLNKDPLTAEDLDIDYLKNISPEEEIKRLHELDSIAEDLTERKIDFSKFDKGKKIYGKIPVESLQRYNKLRRLTLVLELHHFMEEMDGHRENAGNANIDDDCKLWPVTYLFKEPTTVFRKTIEPIDQSFRKPNDKTFQVTTTDLENSPDLKDDNRFIWCTKTDPYPKIIESARTVLKKLLHLSQNAYSHAENELFKQLKDHPVYKFNKNKMYLREILPDSKHFGQIFKLHLRPGTMSRSLNNRSVLEVLSEHLTERQQKFREKLIPSQQFKQFLEEHGDYAMKWIEGKYKKYNAEIQKNIELHKNDPNPGYTTELLVDLKKLKENYQALVRAVKDYQLISIKPTPDTDAPRVRWRPAGA